MTPQDNKKIMFFYQLPNRLSTRRILVVYQSPTVGWIFLVCRIYTFVFLSLLIVLNLMFVCRHNGLN